MTCFIEHRIQPQREEASSRFRLLLTTALITFLFLSVPTGLAQDRYDLAAETEFLRMLEPPGSGNNLLRPENVYVDAQVGEVFVTDPGNNRVVVFDTTGVYLFEMHGKDVLRNIGDAVVDSEGYIYILGSTPESRNIFKFDYDGLLLDQLEISGTPEDFQFDPQSMTISDDDLLYVVNGSDLNIVVTDTDGNYHSQVEVLGDLTEKRRREAVIGQPEVDGGFLYLPVPSQSQVLVYNLDGELERAIGIRGNLIGQLNFPTDVTILDHKIIAVLDKHRYTVVCYSTNGQFLGEFGGMGVRPGKFYHPAYIDHDDQQRVYITQRFMNRVQVCEIPNLITERLSSLEGVSLSTESGSLKSFLQPRLPKYLPEEVVLKTSSAPVSFSSFLFLSNSRRLN